MKRMLRRLSILVVFFLEVVASTEAQDISVTARFDSSRIFIGDQIYFTVEVEKPAGYILTVPVFKDSICKNIEILGGPYSDTTLLKNGKTILRHKYLVTSFDSGAYVVKPVYAELVAANELKRFFSDYSYLEVMRVKITPPDTASRIFDIIGPSRAPLTAGEILPWLLAAVLLAFLIWYLVRVLRKLRSKEKEDAEPVNPDPAHVIAFRELERLKEEHLWEKGELKTYHSRLSDILRQYIDNRFNINAPELTTQEIMVSLARSGIREDENYRNLRTMLTGADLIKFAKYIPEPAENEQYFLKAWSYVEATREREAESQGEGGDELTKGKEI